MVGVPAFREVVFHFISLFGVFLQGVLHCAMETAKLGPLAFYKVWGRGSAGSVGEGLSLPSPLDALGAKPMSSSDMGVVFTGGKSDSSELSSQLKTWREP